MILRLKLPRWHLKRLGFTADFYEPALLYGNADFVYAKNEARTLAGVRGEGYQ
jgi:hypothetical protein